MKRKFSDHVDSTISPKILLILILKSVHPVGDYQLLIPFLRSIELKTIRWKLTMKMARTRINSQDQEPSCVIVCMFVWNRLPNHAPYGDEPFAGDTVGLQGFIQALFPRAVFA